MRTRSLSIFVGYKPATGILVVFFEVVGKLIVIPGLAQPDMSYCLQARGLIEGARRNVDMVVSPRVPEETAAAL